MKIGSGRSTILRVEAWLLGAALITSQSLELLVEGFATPPLSLSPTSLVRRAGGGSDAPTISVGGALFRTTHRRHRPDTSAPTSLLSMSASSSSSNLTASVGSSSSSSSSSSANDDFSDVAPNGATSDSPPLLVPPSPSLPFATVLWKFTRPHTIIGSALAVPSLHLLAAPTWGAALSLRSLGALAAALLPACLMNLYVTGLNQITDVDIDKVNKPYLPIPAGQLSVREATLIVGTSLVASLALGAAVGTQGLNVALWGSAFLGTIYSLPPFRLKRFPALAAFCIVAVRGALINASFYAYARAAAYGGGGAAATTVWGTLTTQPACAYSSLFFAVFGLVIALMKDVPDVLGDRLANIRTFSVRLGPAHVFTGMRRLLSGLFWGVGAAFARSAVRAPSATLVAGRLVTAAAAMWAGGSVRNQAQAVDPQDSDQVYAYYMHLWKLFYLSYLVLPFAR